MGIKHVQPTGWKDNKQAVMPLTNSLVSMAEYVSDMGFYDIEDDAMVEKDIQKSVKKLKAKKKIH